MPQQLRKAKRAEAPQEMEWSLSGKKWLGLVLIVFLTFLVFYPSVNYDFVNWDDVGLVAENKMIQELSTESVKGIFTSTAYGAYTPLTTISFAINYHYFGMNPKSFHITNLIFHLLCTVLVFFMMKSLRMNFFITLSVALLFGIHPMRVESVAWITERKDLLYSLFYFSTIIAYLKYVRSNKKIYYILALAAFVPSLLSKIQAVSLPFSLILIDYFHNRKFIFKQVMNKIPFFILSLITGITGLIILEKQEALKRTPSCLYINAFLSVPYSLWVYLIKSLYTYEMSVIYPFQRNLVLCIT
jgi:hypothetical protein